MWQCKLRTRGIYRVWAHHSLGQELGQVPVSGDVECHLSAGEGIGDGEETGIYSWTPLRALDWF